MREFKQGTVKEILFQKGRESVVKFDRDHVAFFDQADLPEGFWEYLNVGSRVKYAVDEWNYIVWIKPVGQQECRLPDEIGAFDF